MNWYGKLIGGSIGMMFGGFGAAAGAAVGHYFDRKKLAALRREQQKLVVLAAAAFVELSLADGAVTPAEEKTILSVLTELNVGLDTALPPHELPELLRQAHGVARGGEQFANSVAKDPALAERSFLWFLRIAAADGNPNQAEMQFLSRLADQLRIPARTTNRLFTLYVRQNGSFTDLEKERREAASLLGVSVTATQDEIRQAYRTLSLRYHPDRHTGLAPEILELATERFTKIQHAYQLLGEKRVSDSQPSFRLNAQTQQLVPAEPGQIADCLVCGQAVRLLPDVSPLSARCPSCQARLAFVRDELTHL
ncbi:MAG: DnaJ domain-containing protein [Kiritimatiellae bacterium]|nr:DnaJ domain-containing protein [Kiritimatiellia bacterium]